MVRKLVKGIIFTKFKLEICEKIYLNIRVLILNSVLL